MGTVLPVSIIHRKFYPIFSKIKQFHDCDCPIDAYIFVCTVHTCVVFSVDSVVFSVDGVQ